MKSSLTDSRRLEGERIAFSVAKTTEVYFPRTALKSGASLHAVRQLCGYGYSFLAAGENTLAAEALQKAIAHIDLAQSLDDSGLASFLNSRKDKHAASIEPSELAISGTPAWQLKTQLIFELSRFNALSHLGLELPGFEACWNAALELGLALCTESQMAAYPAQSSNFIALCRVALLADHNGHAMRTILATVPASLQRVNPESERRIDVRLAALLSHSLREAEKSSVSHELLWKALEQLLAERLRDRSIATWGGLEGMSDCAELACVILRLMQVPISRNNVASQLRAYYA